MQLSSILILCIAMPGPRPVVGDDGLGREEIRQILKDMWDSYETIEVDANETFIGSGGTPHFEDQIHYIFGSGGRRAWDFERKAVDGETTSVQVDRRHEDGRFRYQVVALPDNPDLTDRMIIDHQENSHEDFKGLLPRAFFAISPFGRPLYLFADEKAEVRPVQEEGQACYELSFNRGKTRVRCVLDPQHDWLARRITVDDGSLDILVMRFQNDGGRWFPAEGRGESVIGEKPDRKPASLSFTTSSLRINHGTDPRAFEMPKVPAGTKIIDRRTGKTTVQGNRRDRAALLRKYQESSRERLWRGADLDNAVTASDAPPGWPWKGTLVGSALLCFTTAVTLHLRRKRRGS